jgi:hypothetical protein
MNVLHLAPLWFTYRSVDAKTLVRRHLNNPHVDTSKIGGAMTASPNIYGLAVF